MTTKFYYNYDEWEAECKNNGWVIENCCCENKQIDCTMKLCRQSLAIDGEIVMSTFKHFINSGTIYTNKKPKC